MNNLIIILCIVIVILGIIGGIIGIILKIQKPYLPPDDPSPSPSPVSPSPSTHEIDSKYYYTIQNMAIPVTKIPQKYLSINDSNILVVENNCTSNDIQNGKCLWQLQKQKDEQYIIKNGAIEDTITNKTLAMISQGLTSYPPVVIKGDLCVNPSTHCLWQLIPQENGYYIIKNMGSGLTKRYLIVDTGGNITSWNECDSTSGQYKSGQCLWKLQKQGQIPSPSPSPSPSPAPTKDCPNYCTPNDGKCPPLTKIFSPTTDQPFCSPDCKSDSDCPGYNSDHTATLKCYKNNCVLVGCLKNPCEDNSGNILIPDDCCTNNGKNRFGDLTTCQKNNDLNGICLPATEK